MEALSPTMEEGRLVEWKKQEGETVAVGDVLAEVETDKAVMELVARVGGVLLRQTVPAGQTVPVSSPIGLIGQPGEAAPAATGNGAGGTAAKGAPPSPPSVAAAPAPRPAALAASTAATPAAAAPGAVRVRASPLARKIAQERGLDIRSIHGSGPEGRVVLRDLEAARPARPAAQPAAPTGTAAGPASAGVSAPPAVPALPAALVPPGERFRDVPLSQMRKTIARRLVQSIGPVPTFYLTGEVDMERVSEAREAMLAAGSDVKVSFNDIVMKAAAIALRQHPACNAWWQEDHIRYWNEVHIGMAVAIDDGLITPVIRHADRKSLREIAAEARDLAARARERRLHPDDYTGATFSISNLGMLDIDEFTAVINPPEAGILAVGRIVGKPVEHAGAVALRRRMRITMSCDHRVIDGATGARFLQTLKAMLENPLAMVW